MVYRSFRAPTWHQIIAAAALLLAAPQLLPERALAQERTPSRIGNRWDGLSHQPTQRDVGAAERELGVAPPTEHDRALDDELERLDRQLLHPEHTNSPPV